MNPLVFSSDRVIRSPLVSTGTQATTSDTAWWTFLGRALVSLPIKYLEVQVTGAGAGSQTAELGLFYSLAPPNKANVTIYPWEVTGTVGAFNSGTGVRRNTNAFARIVDAGVYLWAGMRTANATTQPTCQGLSRDYQHGYVLSTASAGALTSGTSWTGALLAATGTGIDLRATLD